jgi:hypothetical protein
MQRGSIQDEIEKLRAVADHFPEATIVRHLVGICQGLRVLHTASPRPLAHRYVLLVTLSCLAAAAWHNEFHC